VAIGLPEVTWLSYLFCSNIHIAATVRVFDTFLNPLTRACQLHRSELHFVDGRPETQRLMFRRTHFSHRLAVKDGIHCRAQV